MQQRPAIRNDSYLSASGGVPPATFLYGQTVVSVYLPLDSHDVVCYLMVLMNYTCAKEMLLKKVGIFRSALIKKDTINSD